MISRLYSIIILIFLMSTPDISALGEPVPFALLKKVLPDNPIIIEAGAQFGEDTQWMSQFWPRGTIYAFEPSPISFESLEKIATNTIMLFPFSCSLKQKR